MPDRIKRKFSQAADEVEKVVGVSNDKFEKVVDPFRQSVLRRFPVLFILAVTFGITATLVGIEQMLIKYRILQSNPEIILLLGIGVLALTGTLYNKLG